MEKTNVVVSTGLDQIKGVSTGTEKVAIATFKTLKINNNPKRFDQISGQTNKPYTFYTMPSNVFGEYGIKDISRSLNDQALPVNRYGVSLNLSLFSYSDKKTDYLEKVLVKGAQLQSVQVELTFDEKFGLQGRILGYGSIKAPVKATSANTKAATSNSASVPNSQIKAPVDSAATSENITVGDTGL